VPDYIPPRDADALAFMQNFANKLVAAPSAYMISSAEAAGISNAVAQFAAALSDATDPEQRTPVTVSVKDSTRNAAEQLVRQYAVLIKNNAGIPDSDKIAAGVRPVNPSREPIHCPSSSPVLNIVAATQGAHTIRFADSLTPENRGRPFGASELLLWVAVDDEPVTDWNEAKFIGKFTKNPMTVTYQPGDNGKQATYFAKWAGRRGDTSNWSSPVSLAIAA
jgi:hypothetical protein